MNENDIVDYIKSSKAINARITSKVIITLRGMDDNAKLLAKELKLSIWDADTVNMLLGFYGKRRLVLL